MDSLLRVGFELAGHWRLDNDSLTLELIRHASQKNVLYAFVCDGQIKYVGKTVSSLATRLAGYRRPAASQSTNIKCSKRIIDALSKGAAVDIFALPDNGLLHYGQFHLNLADGLEYDMIRVINPEWNGTRIELSEPTRMTDAPADPLPFGGTFRFVLQPTYYRTGFFNVLVGDQRHLGADGECIELFLGNTLLPLLGTINRRANNNGTPRVMGGFGLRDWFQSTAKERSVISVQVLSPTSIRLKPLDQASGTA